MEMEPRPQPSLTATVSMFGLIAFIQSHRPLSPVTNAYNEALTAHLPGKGIEVREIPRKTQPDGENPISASAVRALLGQGQAERLKTLVPESTYRYLQEHNMI